MINPSCMILTGREHTSRQDVYKRQAKKMEFRQERVRPYIDSVITFEELQALIDSRDIDISSLDEDVLDNADVYKRQTLYVLIKREKQSAVFLFLTCFFSFLKKTICFLDFLIKLSMFRCV